METELACVCNMKKKFKIGIADTTFAVIDMAAIAIEAMKKNATNAEIIRYTVPGIKDLPVACKQLFTNYKCNMVISLGMVGKEPVDKVCGHEASLGHQMVQTSIGKHIVEAFVHMEEAKDDADLYELTKNRVEKHTLNALELLKGPTALQDMAGTGRRQGREDAGQIALRNNSKKASKNKNQ